ncbi:hypothetical protein [uncultured Chryseobacterium sp.]|uniref:hypothetical protein n=1 Tax=uncultured Chryseobacterium sp. TaxID=259322 RepID=UPI00258E02FA|nr:hypothetical protein [uncultured Chryseobacterium sp.]
MTKKQKVQKAINLLLEELRGVDFDTACHVVDILKLHLKRNSTVNINISDIDKVKILNENFDYLQNTF